MCCDQYPSSAAPSRRTPAASERWTWSEARPGLHRISTVFYLLFRASAFVSISNYYIIMVNKIEITLTFSYIFLSTTERVLYNAKYPQSSVLLPQSSQSETSLQLMVTPSLLCLSASICHGSLASEPAAIVGRFTDAIMINA